MAITLKIQNQDFSSTVQYFNQVNINLVHNAIASTFSFNFDFNPDNPEHKKLIKPGAFYECQILYNNTLLITGYIVSHAFKSDAQSNTVTLSGYSKPGILENSQIDLSSYPLQNNGLTLLQITERLINPLGLSYEVDSRVLSAANEKLTKSVATPTQSIKSYLNRLALEKDIILSCTPEGKLFFTQSNTDQEPIIEIDTTSEKGAKPAISLMAKVNFQDVHSSITALRQASLTQSTTGQSTINNPLLTAITKPKVVKQTSGTTSDARKLAQRTLAAELRNINFTFSLDRVEASGGVITQNKIITVKDPNIYLYNKTKLFIESVNLEFNHENEGTAEITATLPEAYGSTTSIVNPFQ